MNLKLFTTWSWKIIIFSWINICTIPIDVKLTHSANIVVICIIKLILHAPYQHVFFVCDFSSFQFKVYCLYPGKFQAKATKVQPALWDNWVLRKNNEFGLHGTFGETCWIWRKDEHFSSNEPVFQYHDIYLVIWLKHTVDV